MSLRWRLFVFVFIPVAMLYYGFGIYGVFQTRSELIADLDNDLVVSSANTAALVDTLTNEQIADILNNSGPASPRLTAVVDVVSGEVSLNPATRDGIEQSIPADSALQPEQLVRRLDQPLTIPAADDTVSYRTIATRLDGGRILVIGEPLDRIDRLTRRFLLGTLVTGLGILAAMATVVYLAIRNGLRPLATFIETTTRVADGDLTERVDPSQNDPGFAEIARATNHMLDQVEASHEQQRQSSERLNDLIADAAHELRTPLTAIRGTVDMQRLGAIDSDEKLRTAFIGLDDHSLRMAKIVDDIIVIARAEKLRIGTQDRSASTVDLRVLLEQQVQRFKQSHPDRYIDFVVDDASHQIAGQPSFVSEALDQLLENALVHTTADSEIHVRLRRANAQIHIEFSDTGPGIPGDIKDRLFDRFVRGERSRARSTGGAGLGLSIVQSIIEASGGTVRLEERPGPGCTFVLAFPAVNGQLHDAPVPEARADNRNHRTREPERRPS